MCVFFGPSIASKMPYCERCWGLIVWPRVPWDLVGYEGATYRGWWYCDACWREYEAFWAGWHADAQQ